MGFLKVLEFYFERTIQPLAESECIFKRLLDNRKEKGTRAQMCPAIASGIITGDRLFSRLAYKLSSNVFTSASGRFFYVFCGKSEQESESSWCWGQLPEPEVRSERL